MYNSIVEYLRFYAEMLIALPIASIIALHYESSLFCTIMYTERFICMDIMLYNIKTVFSEVAIL